MQCGVILFFCQNLNQNFSHCIIWTSSYVVITFFGLLTEHYMNAFNTWKKPAFLCNKYWGSGNYIQKWCYPFSFCGFHKIEINCFAYWISFVDKEIQFWMNILSLNMQLFCINMRQSKFFIEGVSQKMFRYLLALNKKQCRLLPGMLSSAVHRGST